MTLPRAIHAVVFDMDGLLVDTETLVRDAVMAQVEDMGLDLPMPVFLSLVGTNHATSNVILQDHFGDGFDLDDFHARWVTRFRVVAEAGIALKAGVVELLDHLDAAGLPYAVCTSSPHREVDRNLAPYGLKDRFAAIVAAGDYPRGKPHPDPFLAAAAALGVAPEHCLALEDSHNGVRAAHAAGMMTIMVPDLLEATDEIGALCVQVLGDLHEVRALIAALANEETA